MEKITAAAEMPAVWAAIGVDFLMFRKPSVPQDVLTIDLPALSVTWMCVLVNNRTINEIFHFVMHWNLTSQTDMAVWQDMKYFLRF